MYIAYLPKNKGETIKNRKIINFLNFYINNSSNKYFVIAAPGYMSKQPRTIDDYLTHLGEIFNQKNQTEIGILNGMNGHHIISNNTTVLDAHNDLLHKHGFQQIKLNAHKEFDHRKMICFATAKVVPNEITLKDLDDFLNNVYVGGILIGSSNQSNCTYFQQVATKGESDIFMFDDSADPNIKKIIESLKYNEPTDIYPSELSDIVLTKSFYGKGHYDTQKFFKEILRNVLESGLES